MSFVQNSTNQNIVNGTVSIVGGSAGSPSLAFPTSGFFEADTNVIGVSTNNTEIGRISANGIAINTGADPVAGLPFQANASGVNCQATLNGTQATGWLAFTYNATATQSPSNTFGHSRGTIASPTTTVNADTLGSFRFQGYGTTGFKNSAIMQIICIEPTPSDTAMGGSVRFNVAPLGGVAAFTTSTEVMRLESPGAGKVNVGIGVTSMSANLHLKGGTATAGTAPLKINSGIKLTTPEDGAIEYDGSHFYGTSGTTRYQLDQQTTIGILSTTTGINGKTVANTALYTVPTGKTAVITGFVVRCSAASSITTGPSAGVGNTAGTNNISASQAMMALISTTTSFNWPIVGMSVVSTAASTIYFNLGTAATGTSQTLSVDLLGYLV